MSRFRSPTLRSRCAGCLRRSVGAGAGATLAVRRAVGRGRLLSCASLGLREPVPKSPCRPALILGVAGANRAANQHLPRSAPSGGTRARCARLRAWRDFLGVGPALARSTVNPVVLAPSAPPKKASPSPRKRCLPARDVRTPCHVAQLGCAGRGRGALAPAGPDPCRPGSGLYVRRLPATQARGTGAEEAG